MRKASVFSLKSYSSRPRHCEIITEREGERKRGIVRERTREIKCLQAFTHHRPARKYTSNYIFFWGWKSTQLKHHERNISVSMCVRSHRMTNERTAYTHRAKRPKNPGTPRPTQCARVCTLVEVLLFKLEKKYGKKLAETYTHYASTESRWFRLDESRVISLGAAEKKHFIISPRDRMISWGGGGQRA